MASTNVEDRRWEARNDLSTLVSADAIKSDSKRFKAAQAENKRQQKALKKVAKPIVKKATKKRRR